MIIRCEDKVLSVQFQYLGGSTKLINVMLDCLMNWSHQARCDCETLFALKSFELKSMPGDEFYVTTKYLCPNPL